MSRDQRAMLGDVVAFSAMVGLGETYLAAFVLAVGHGEVAAGLVATLPMLAGAVLQLVTPYGVVRFGSYRRWVVLCARLQAAALLALGLSAAGGSAPLAWIFAAAAAYFGFGMATGPAWNAWVGGLVPAGERAAFFARRSRYGQAAHFAAILAGGLLLDFGRVRGATLAAFAALFCLATAARLVSARFLDRQSEAAGLAAAHRTLSPRELAARLRGSEGGRLLVYLLGMQVAVYVSAPFFAPFMLGPLGLSYAGFTAITGTAFVARIAALPLLGRMAHVRGTRRLLWLGALGIVPLPALWLLSHHFAWLLAIQVMAGVAWAALELATLLAFFEGLPEDERASILTAYNLANAVAIALGALLGSRLFGLLGEGADAYAALFVASSLGRAGTLLLLRRVRHAG